MRDIEHISWIDAKGLRREVFEAIEFDDIDAAKDILAYYGGQDGYWYDYEVGVVRNLLDYLIKWMRTR